MSTKTIVRAEDVHEGDKLTLTFTHHDVEHVITGKVRTVYAGHAVGSWPLQYVLMRGGKIERHTPEWQSARVVHVAGRTFHRYSAPEMPWFELRAPGAYGAYYGAEYLAALGTPRIIIDEDGNPA